MTVAYVEEAGQLSQERRRLHYDLNHQSVPPGGRVATCTDDPCPRFRAAEDLLLGFSPKIPCWSTGCRLLSGHPGLHDPVPYPDHSDAQSADLGEDEQARW